MASEEATIARWRAWGFAAIVAAIVAFGFWWNRWQEFRSPDGEFVATMPGTPKLTTNDIVVGPPIGTLREYMWISHPWFGYSPHEYFVMYADVPDAAFVPGPF